MKDVKDNVNSAPGGWGCRHTFALLLSFGAAVSYAMRFNLSIAIVAMVNHTKSIHASGPIPGGNNSSFVPCEHLLHDIGGRIASSIIDSDIFTNDSFLEVEAAPESSYSSGGQQQQGEFNWSEVEQGVILGSFFWGYIITQIPGGLLSKKFGGKWPFGIGLLISAVFAILTPWCARTHRGLLIFARVVQGLGSGMHISCQMTLLAAWAPPQERSSLATIACGGTFLGTAVALIGSGYLIHANVLGGWPSVFYVTGLISIIWFVLWSFFAFSTPGEHPRISVEEKNYIENSIGAQNTQSSGPTPWRDIVTSVPILACMIAHIAHSWGIYTLLTEMPTYMNSVLHFDIKKNSWMSAIPYITSWVFGIAFGNIADVLLRRKYVSILKIRKTAQLVGHAGSAIALIGAAYSGCNRMSTVLFLIISVALTSACNSGFMVSYVDCTPNYAGIIMGVVNTLANFAGIGAPYVAGLITNNNPSVENWRLVFLLSAGIMLFAAVFFTVFSSGEEQPWNNFQKLQDEEQKGIGKKEVDSLVRNPGTGHVILRDDLPTFYSRTPVDEELKEALLEALESSGRLTL